MSHAVDGAAALPTVLGHVRDGVLRPLVAGRVGGRSGRGSGAVLGVWKGQILAARGRLGLRSLGRHRAGRPAEHGPLITPMTEGRSDIVAQTARNT